MNNECKCLRLNKKKQKKTKEKSDKRNDRTKRKNIDRTIWLMDQE